MGRMATRRKTELMTMTPSRQTKTATRRRTLLAQISQRCVGTMVYPEVNSFTSAEPGLLTPALSEMNNFVIADSGFVSSFETSSPSCPTPDRTTPHQPRSALEFCPSDTRKDTWNNSRSTKLSNSSHVRKHFDSTTPHSWFFKAKGRGSWRC
jgi:hypothetical protein